MVRQSFLLDQKSLLVSETCYCPSGKRCYGLKDARTAANARTTGRQVQRRNRPTFLRVYKCDLCEWHHLTHSRSYAG